MRYILCFLVSLFVSLLLINILQSGIPIEMMMVTKMEALPVLPSYDSTVEVLKDFNVQMPDNVNVSDKKIELTFWEKHKDTIGMTVVWLVCVILITNVFR